MRPKSISGLSCAVADLSKTITFYENLGFRVSHSDEQTAIAYVNWFSIEFNQSNDSDTTPKSGPNILISVVIEEFYAGVIGAGYTPEVDLHKTSTGRQEFSLRDPSGYLLTFFEK